MDPKILKRSREGSPPAPELDLGDNEEQQRKFSRLDPETLSATPQQPAVICVEKPLCRSRPFGSYGEYEAHYAEMHTNRCTECHKNFPSERFLELHIKERRMGHPRLLEAKGAADHAP